MLITADSTRRIQMITTDKQGNFRLDSILFFGKSKLFFSDIRGKKNQYIDAHLSDDSLTKYFQLPGISKQPFLVNNRAAIAYSSKIDMDYDAIMKAKGIMLEGVIVKAKNNATLMKFISNVNDELYQLYDYSIKIHKKNIQTW